MLSRGKNRFVDEIHIPIAELRSSAKLLSELQKSEEGKPLWTKSKTSKQETGAVHLTSPTSIKETCADTLSIFPSQASFYTQRTIPTTNRKWKVVPVNSSYWRALWIAVSKMVTRMVRHYDQDERQSDGSLHFGRHKAGTAESVRKTWSTRFLRWTMASTYSWRKAARPDSSTARIPKIPWLTFEQFKDTWWNTIWPWTDGVHSNSLQLERVYLSQGCSFSIIQSFLENGLVPEGKERHEGRQTVFLTPLNPFGGDSDCEEPSDDCTVPQKVHCHCHWKHDQDGVHWVTWSRAQDQGLQFVQPKSHAIIVHNLVPAECIYKVISQIRGRPLFERLSTPRPVPQVTLKSHWQSQQQQQSICDDVSTSTRKLVTDQTGIQWCQRLHNGWSD